SFTGEDDPFIPAAQVISFRQEMENAGVYYIAVTYSGAKHSFTNPDADKFGQEFELPLAYNPAANMASWNASLQFLADAFKK
ncbi:MAG: dienelactone hydrolase family protein, partial [Pseudomonadota bacterium]